MAAAARGFVGSTKAQAQATRPAEGSGATQHGQGARHIG